MATGDDRGELPPGWYVRLEGERVDLNDWIRSLNEPFDPVAFEEADGTVLLTSKELDGAADAGEARERGLALVGRLNGAMALMHSADPVRLGSIIRVDAQGRRHFLMFADALNIRLGRTTISMMVQALGPDGKPLPPPPPQPSAAQLWNEVAGQDDDIADLMEQLGRAQGWYEIYKTIELAEVVVGGKHKLERLLGGSRAECMNMRQTANYFRHARAPKPGILTRLDEAGPLLNYMVRVALENRRP